MFAERKVIPLHSRGALPSEPSRFGPNEPHMNLRVLWGLAQWVRDRRGSDVLEELAGDADLPADHLDGRSHWVSHDRFEAFLSGCRALMGSDEEFERACTHRLPEAYGPLRFALRAMTPRLMYVQAAKSLHMVSRISRVEVLDEGHNFIKTRYLTERPESPLMSLSRDAQTKAIPTLWGLPQADVRVPWRDEAGNCEYEVRWQVKPSWVPMLAGAMLAGLLAALGATTLGFFDTGLAISMMLIGAALGHIIDLRRTARLNQSYSSSQTEALEELAAEAFEAKREAFELSHRQQDWSRMMEERVDDRNRELRALRERLVGSANHDRLRGVSHDLRSPLQLITSHLDLLKRRRVAQQDAHLAIAIDELDRSAQTMSGYLEELMSSFTEEPRFVS